MESIEDSEDPKRPGRLSVLSMEPELKMLESTEPSGREEEEEEGNAATGEDSGEVVIGTAVREMSRCDCFFSLSAMRLILDSSSRMRDWRI